MRYYFCILSYFSPSRYLYNAFLCKKLKLKRNEWHESGLTGQRL